MVHTHLRIAVEYLRVVAEQSGLASIRKISESVGLSQTSISSMTKYYAAHGIISYCVDSSNTRRATLTPKGVKLYGHLVKALDCLNVEGDYKTGLEVERSG